MRAGAESAPRWSTVLSACSRVADRCRRSPLHTAVTDVEARLRGCDVRQAVCDVRVEAALNRIAAVVRNLRVMGAEVEEFPDGLRVPGGQTLNGAQIETFDDHRIAMAFAVAGLRANGDTEIRGAECASISFPGFFDLLESLTRR